MVGSSPFLPLDDEDADRLLATVPEDARGECWWLVLPDRTAVPGDAGGGIALLAELRLTRRPARALRALGASALLGAVDKRVARNRGRLGRFVPEGPAPRRYP